MTQSRPIHSFERAAKDEIARLIEQSEFQRGITTRFLRAVGLRPGMNVLILGCGAGDDAFLAAEMVGETGHVTGIDMVAEKVEVCRRRADENGSANVSFETSTIEAFDRNGFDVAFGRYLLMHCADPVRIVRAASRLVVPNGVIGFYEIDLLGACMTNPTAPMFDAQMARMVEAPRAYLPSPDAARRLLGIFVEAGLPAPDLLCERPTAGHDPMPLSRWAAGFASKAQAYFEPDAPPLDQRRLAEAFRDDILAAGSQVASYDQWLAWSRTERRS